METIFILVFIAIIIIFLTRALIVVKENERIVQLRSGKLFKIIGPGLALIIPFIDTPVVMNLTKLLPDWQSMTNEEINEDIKKLVLNDPDPDKYK